MVCGGAPARTFVEDNRMAKVPTQQLNDEDMELLSAYIDGQLPATERAALEVRLGAEAALRLALDELRATVTALRTLEPVRPPRSFTLDPAQVAPRRAGRFNLLRLLPLAGTMAAVLVCAVVTLGVWSQSGLNSGGSTGSAPVAAVAEVPTAAPETSAIQAPAAPAAMEAAPAAGDLANADTAARSASTPSPAGTSAPAATAAPAMAAQEGAPQAVAEPTAKLESYAEGTPAPGVAAAEPPLTSAQNDAAVATPAGSSPDTLELATPAPAAPVAAAPRPAVSPLVLIGLPLLFLALGFWLFVVARRR